MPNPHRHDPADCPLTTCRYCGPDAGMWAIGEAAVAPFVLAGQILWWLARHPATAVILAVAGLVAALVLGVL